MVMMKKKMIGIKILMLVSMIFGDVMRVCRLFMLVSFLLNDVMNRLDLMVVYSVFNVKVF